MKMTKTLLTVAALAFSFNAFAVDESASKTFPTPQSAEGNYAAHVGVIGAYTDQNGAYKPSVGYGVDAGFQPYVPFGLGIQALFYNSSYDRAGTGSAGVKRTEILARATYNFGGESIWTKYLYAGAKFGVVIQKPYTEALNGDDTDGNTYARFALAPVIGFDAPIASHLTAGLEATYLFVTGPEVNQDTFQVALGVKYWF